MSGPADIVFDDDRSLQTVAQFPVSGVYELELTAFEGVDTDDLASSDTITVTIYDDVITTADGLGADSSIGGTSDSSDESIAIRRNNFQLKAYLRFDLNSIEKDQLDSSALFLQMTGNPVFVVDSTINVFGLLERTDCGESILDELWSEDQIDYQSAPGNLTTGTGGAYDPE